MDEKIILKWILEQEDGGGGGFELDFSGLWLIQVAGFCEHGNEPCFHNISVIFD
jgi:hypothetical protein